MYSTFIEAFFGSGYQPTDFELTFALVVLILMIHGLSTLVYGLFKAVK